MGSAWGSCFETAWGLRGMFCGRILKFGKSRGGPSPGSFSGGETAMEGRPLPRFLDFQTHGISPQGRVFLFFFHVESTQIRAAL